MREPTVPASVADTVEQAVQGGDVETPVTDILPAHPAESAWVDFAGDIERQGADLCRVAAKRLVNILAFLFPAYVALLVLAKGNKTVSPTVDYFAVLPPFLWSLSTCVLVWLLLPWKWRVVHFDGTGIRRSFLQMVRRRVAWTYVAVALLILGIFVSAGFMARVVSVR